MTSSELVFRAGRNGKVWHWCHERHHDMASRCLGWPLVGDGIDPVSVRIEDRCTAKGCAVRWDAWLRATVAGALAAAARSDADEAERLWGAA